MCGINGIVCCEDSAERHRSLLEDMNAVLQKRGPDDEGYFIHKNVGLSHRRLSIIDLSSQARQPLCNEAGTIWLVHNGEIYNHCSLRSELVKLGHTFRSRTDSEVIVHSYETWGLDLLARLDGMFAFALYDQEKQKLILAKDRFGKKPLYYTFQGGYLLFSSSLLAFRNAKMVDWRLDLEALLKYMAYEYVPTPHTIIRNVHKLPMAHYMEFSTRTAPRRVPVPRPYWQHQFQPKLDIREDEARGRLVELLDSAVRKRLMSDVPLGVFLSGGMDSSSIVARMAEQMEAKTIKTFTIGFSEESYDESLYAKQVAKHFGTDHHQIEVKSEDVTDALPEVLCSLDEPFADSSLIPTYLLCKFAGETVRVALEGSGADELLAGYDTFVAHRIARYYRAVPTMLNRLMCALAETLPVSNRYMSLDFRIKRFLSGFQRNSSGLPEIRDLVWMSSFSPDALMGLCATRLEARGMGESVFCEAVPEDGQDCRLDYIDRIVRHYIRLYLHDDILFKADRASMMNSLEVRSPFLDSELSDFLNRLPTTHKMKGFTRKYLLKKAMAKSLPNSIIGKRKQGFQMPVGDWLKGRLRPQLQDCLSQAKIRKLGLFNPSYVDRLMKEHFEGRRDNRKPLWTLLVGMLWIERNSPAIW